MYTLDEKILLQISTMGFTTPNYVITTFYYNSVGVFKGRSYVEYGQNAVECVLNDIIMQNRGKFDYIKLSSAGKLDSVTLFSDTWGGVSYKRRYNQGQAGIYKVQCDQNNTYNSEEVSAIAAYNYPNKNLRPNCIDYDQYNVNSSLDRLMTGVNWVWNKNDNIGTFDTLLLPHYPFKDTERYGLGLQLYFPVKDLSADFSLIRHKGDQMQLGVPVYNQSSMTFVTLQSLLNNTSTGETEEGDYENVYLKLTNSSTDVFGTYHADYTDYYVGKTIMYLEVYRRRAGSSDDFQLYTTIARDDRLFEQSLQSYINQAITQLPSSSQQAQLYNTVRRWDAYTITNNPDTVVGSITVHQSGSAIIWDLGWENFYTSNNVITNTISGYEFMSRPKFTTITTQTYHEAYYDGNCKVALLDKCYAKYYLAWVDRYGDIQSQPFEGKIEYSESVETEEIQDYCNYRRPSQKIIQPAWKLNTKWINEDYYPVYESIFTSPYLLLYDTEQDKSWNVIVTDNKYTEKTYKNQKHLINLEINVELNKKENYIF